MVGDWTPENPHENVKDILEYAEYVKSYAEAYLIGNKTGNPVSYLLDFSGWFYENKSLEVKNEKNRETWICEKSFANDEDCI